MERQELSFLLSTGFEPLIQVTKTDPATFIPIIFRKAEIGRQEKQGATTMLTLKERQEVLKWFRCFCTIGLLPMQVDVEGWKVRADTTTLSWASKAWYASFVAHSLYKILNFIYTLLFFHGIPLHQMIIHGVLASAAADFSLWYYILYVKYPNENAALIRMTLTRTITAGITRNGLVQQ